jgi:hypothetical protein
MVPVSKARDLVSGLMMLRARDGIHAAQIPLHTQLAAQAQRRYGAMLMATIYKELTVPATAEDVSAAIRDVAAVHTRLAREFVTDTRLDGDSRLVTFANGTVIRERIITIDDERRRLAYSVVEWQATHHNATFQVIADGDRRTRIVWIADLLPNNLANLVNEQMSQGVEAIKRTMEREFNHG